MDLNRVFSQDVTAVILVFENNETAAMLVYQDNPVGIELFSYVKDFFCSNKLAQILATLVKLLYNFIQGITSSHLACIVSVSACVPQES